MSFLTNSPQNHTVLSWAHAQDRRVETLGSLKDWQALARTLERGCFDAVFFADVLGGYDRYRDRADEAIRYGVWWPTHDPAPVLAAMAAATDHLGLALTLSLSGTHPYLAVRSLGTLDVLSGGRVGWNIVTGAQRAEHRALGLEQMEHDERYDRAEEYLAICHAFWDAVAEDAVVFDKAARVLTDPAKVKRVRHQGRYLRTDAIPGTFRSPQGRPVLFQAGSSGRGQDFAIRYADVMFAIQRHPDSMTGFMSQLKAKASSLDLPAPPVIFGVQAILGGTEEEALRHQHELRESIPIEAALSRLSGSMGVDFEGYDLDRPMEELDTQGSRGLMASAAAAVGNTRLTLREAAILWGTSSGMPQIVGTPETVAERLEFLWRTTGCHGFNLTPAVNPGSTTDFVDQVVPLLQRRGIYRTEYEGTTLRANLLGAQA